MKKLSRRQLLGSTALAAGTFVGGNKVLTFGQTAVTPPFPEVSWKYTVIDPLEAARLAYEIYPDGHCMYAAFRGIVTTVATALSRADSVMSARLLEFPFYMMKIGSGGFGGMGSLCGAVAGCAQAVSLFVPDKAANNMMVQELFQYYEMASLPSYLPENDAFPQMVSVESKSPLCHLSVTAWCKKSGEGVFSPIRAERCRRLSADMVIATVNILNRSIRDEKCSFAPLSEPTKSCVDCHGKGGAAEDTLVKMNCSSCHEIPKEHPIRTKNK
ncbi:MAG: C-GCAxxG-C-C family (seleno)protein [Thermoguttaceae bacterium]